MEAAATHIASAESHKKENITEGIIPYKKHFTIFNKWIVTIENLLAVLSVT